MKCFSGKLRITGLLTFLCILLLSTTAMADEVSGKEQTAEDVQSERVQTDKQTIKNETGNEESSEHNEASEKEIGPGIKKETEPPKTEPAGPVYEKGASLGFFSATAYCPSRSGKIGRTYSGTVPTANHTLSADITLLPIGTKVMIDDVIYTVEDTGSSIKGKKIDIFFGSRQEALNFGRQTKELFAVVVK
ncbi:3D domain-containing protein [Lacrimispora sp. JR3]|uniref:3D domain-containing protein n=1 Tax=Lacrimispora sinapis TaxID=3111456 RepID=UPI00374A0374